MDVVDHEKQLEENRSQLLPPVGEPVSQLAKPPIHRLWYARDE